MSPEEIAEYIRRLVDEAPPLSEEVRAKLAPLLRPAADRKAS